MDPVARKIIGVLAVVAAVILGVVVLVSAHTTNEGLLAGGVIAAGVAAGVLLL